MVTNRQIEEYCQNGFAGPFKVETNQRDFDEIRDHVEEVLETSGPWERDDLPSILTNHHKHGANTIDRHVDCSWISKLSRNPAIIDKLVSIYEQNLILYFSQFINKEPGGKEIAWHDDCGFHELHPACWATVWIAFDRVTSDNGCLEFLPGTNDTRTEHVRTDEEDNWFPKHAVMRQVEEKITHIDPVQIEMKPGEFLIFDNRVLHRSARNTSSDRRLALQLRVTKPFTHSINPKRPQSKPILINGENPHNIHNCLPSLSDCKH
jgi:ectoine hydroxylase-related dioxygenase (phytanoyl-CoA dioxygenase family)